MPGKGVDLLDGGGAVRDAVSIPIPLASNMKRERRAKRGDEVAVAREKAEVPDGSL